MCVRCTEAMCTMARGTKKSAVVTGWLRGPRGAWVRPSQIRRAGFDSGVAPEWVLKAYLFIFVETSRRFVRCPP